ncbi:NAD(P)H-binding protein [Streptomyces sp. ME19-01-6]|uniref:NAD(P)H-binding protein n=1 Tax=Streptomyces sp. ME19-01-6 TaxID=3028686 RepID=UPI0029BBE2FB|nr:NAD(P)H-binding protein [Streptomyces sp. ME19-01-6]MDX3226129.1 NAD(P)H-binding protein [Streptomyces sp. ME19-01-6]
MAAERTILVTGATGNVGRQVVSQLMAGHTGEVRALTRDPASAALPGGVDVRQGDLADPAALEAALKGADAVFLMWPFHGADPAPAVVDAIKWHAGRVVFLSSGAVQEGVAPERQAHPVGRSHACVEHLIEGAGLLWTHLRPSTFAANTLWWADQIRAGDVVRGAYGAVPMALLHEADIAAVAVRALTEDGHGHAAYTLTGPEVLTQEEQVGTIGEVLGRPLRWRELSREEERQRLLADDSFPDSFVNPLLDGYADMLDAPPPATTGAVEAVTGVPARTYRAWVSDHAADFT